MDTKFLQSNRFWALVLVAVLGVLKSEGILGSQIIDPLIALLVGFVGIRSVDRFSEKLSIPAE